jgi:hypothetical protein
VAARRPSPRIIVTAPEFVDLVRVRVLVVLAFSL